MYYASTVDDAGTFGNFDDAPIYEAMKTDSKDRKIFGIEILREEMLPLWKEFQAMPNHPEY
jgi:hypothetical protein